MNPAVPEAVAAILGAPSAQAGLRFVSAGAMGEACDHYLYDKGYGPTNLTLKHYLASVFGRGLLHEAADDERSLAPTLIPRRDEVRRTRGRGHHGVVSPLKKVIVAR